MPNRWTNLHATIIAAAIFGIALIGLNNDYASLWAADASAPPTPAATLAAFSKAAERRGCPDAFHAGDR